MHTTWKLTDGTVKRLRFRKGDLEYISECFTVDDTLGPDDMCSYLGGNPRGCNHCRLGKQFSALYSLGSRCYQLEGMENADDAFNDQDVAILRAFRKCIKRAIDRSTE